jgi:hypothetical protein
MGEKCLRIGAASFETALACTAHIVGRHTVLPFVLVPPRLSKIGFLERLCLMQFFQ